MALRDMSLSVILSAQDRLSGALQTVEGKLGGALETLRNGRDPVLVVSGDRETPHKYIAAVLEAAARAGFSHVRINAEVKAKEE